jgi:hypothetical protein
MTDPSPLPDSRADRFDERSQTVVRGVLAIIVVITLCAMVLLEHQVPACFQNLGFAIVAFFIGARVAKGGGS